MVRWSWSIWNVSRSGTNGLECSLLAGTWEIHCNNLRLVLGLELVRVSSRVRIRVKVRVSVMVRVSIRTSLLGGELRPISLLPASNLHSS